MAAAIGERIEELRGLLCEFLLEHSGSLRDINEPSGSVVFVGPHLAVVAGLEEGYETVVKIFPNPLRTLEFKPSSSVTLAGITGRRSGLEVRFPSRGD